MKSLNSEILFEFIDKSNRLLMKFNGNNTFPLEVNYLIENCIRSYHVLRALEHLIKNHVPIEELEHPIGILLRSGLNDFINFQYISNKSIKGGKMVVSTFEKEAREYMNGHFNRVDKEYVLREDLKGLDRFQDYGKKERFKELGILKEGINFAKSKKLNYLEVAINNWEWYSKYEHHGVFTNLMYETIEDNHYRNSVSVELICCNMYLSLLVLIDIGFEDLSLDEVEKLPNFLSKLVRKPDKK